MALQLINSDRFHLPGTNDRFMHLATCRDGVHEYVAFFDKNTQKCYIEEATTGQLEFIESDDLATEIKEFLEGRGIMNMLTGLPLAPDQGQQ